MTAPKFAIDQVMRFLPHRYPFLLVDRILKIVPGKSITGLKNVTINEPFFSGHFPGYPVMPGVLIIEALAQTGGIFALDTLDLKVSEHPDTRIFFMGIDRARFRKPVRPGDTLIMTVELLNRKRNIWKFAGRAEVNGQLASEAEMMASIGA